MVETRNVICTDNVAFRMLLPECGLRGVSPVTKRASRLNTHVVDFGGCVVVMLVPGLTDLEVAKRASTI